MVMSDQLRSRAASNLEEERSVFLEPVWDLELASTLSSGP